MRMELMTLSLMMVAGTPALAMAQGCTEAEAVLRADAVQLGPVQTQMTTVSNEYQMKQKLITDEYDFSYYYYGTKPGASPGPYVGNLESEKVALEHGYNTLMATAQPLDAKVTKLVASYEAASGAVGTTADLLNQCGIVVLLQQRGQ